VPLATRAPAARTLACWVASLMTAAIWAGVGG